jgi:hypothetical protein
VKDQHGEPLAFTGHRVFQHLSITGGIAERGVWPASDHQVDAFGLPSIVVV